MARLDIPRYSTPDDLDGDFDGAVADEAVVADAWKAWREEIAFAEAAVDRATDLPAITGVDGDGEPISLRELLVHMVEEYARLAWARRPAPQGRIGRIGQ